LDDHIVSAVYVELHFGSGVAVTKTELRFALRHFAQTLHETRKMKTDTYRKKTVQIDRFPILAYMQNETIKTIDTCVKFIACKTFYINFILQKLSKTRMVMEK